MQDLFDSLCGEPQPSQMTSSAKCKHVGSEIWGHSLMKASYFLLIFGFMICFVLWCPQPSFLFVKELGKLLINGQAKFAPTLIHSPSWMGPFFDNNSKMRQRNVKIELRDLDLVWGSLYTKSQGWKNSRSTLSIFGFLSSPKLFINVITLAMKVANWLPKFVGILFSTLEPIQGHIVQHLLVTWARLKIFFLF
jgi:hypothetical protein